MWEGVWKAEVLYTMNWKSHFLWRDTEKKGKGFFPSVVNLFCWGRLTLFLSSLLRWDREQEIGEVVGYRGVAEYHTASNQIVGNTVLYFRNSPWTLLCGLHTLLHICQWKHFHQMLAAVQFHVNFGITYFKATANKEIVCYSKRLHKGTFSNVEATR